VLPAQLLLLVLLLHCSTALLLLLVQQTAEKRQQQQQVGSVVGVSGVCQHMKSRGRSCSSKIHKKMMWQVTHQHCTSLAVFYPTVLIVLLKRKRMAQQQQQRKGLACSPAVL
jgi:sugar phosphate permease